MIAEVRTSGLFRTRRMPIFRNDGRPGQNPAEMYLVQRHLSARTSFKPGQMVALYGKVEEEVRGELQLMQPQFEILGDSDGRR